MSFPSPLGIIRHRIVLPAAVVLMAGCHDATAPRGIVGPLTLTPMQVGDVQGVSFSQLGSQGLTIPAAADGAAQYLMVVANVGGGGDAVPRYTISGAVQFAGQISLPGLSQNTLGSADAARFGAQGGFANALPAGVRLETLLRAYERQHLSPSSHLGGAPMLRRSVQLSGPLAEIVPDTGTQLTLHTLTAAGFGGASASLCDSYQTTTATVRAVSNHAIIVTDDSSPSGGFTTAELQDIGQEFDNMIYPTDTSYFGTPTDFDNNGHIIIFFTPSVNKLTPPGRAMSSGYIGGFFFAGDLFPASQCHESNQGELFYLLTPDPHAADGNTFTHDFVRQVTRGTVAHELQHMINAGNRILDNAPTFEATWLDEALAHFAEDAVGRSESGIPPDQTMTINDLLAVPDSDVQAFFLQNFVRAKYYATGPDTIGPIVSHQRATQDLAARGAEWALLRYVTDQFVHGDVHVFTHNLVAGPDTGVVNLTARAGAPLDSILGNWLVTMYTDHQGIPSLPSRFNYRSYTMRSLISIVFANGLTTGSYLPVGAIDSGSTSLSVGVPSTSAAYFLVSQSAGVPQAIHITATSGSVQGDPNGRLYLVRIQ